MILILVIRIIWSKQCKECQCYELKCTRLEQPSDNCLNLYNKSCDSKFDIVPYNNCAEECDCCLEGKCVGWNDVNCLMYRSFEIHLILYFLLVTANIFIFSKVYERKFSIEVYLINDD